MAAARGVAPSSMAPPPASPTFVVFVDSSLGTHLAMLARPDDHVALFKRKIKAEHALCFPSIGEITVLALKVKRRASFYHLSDSMLVTSAFDGIKGTRFLYIDAEATSMVKHQAGVAENAVHPDCRLLETVADKTLDVVRDGSSGERSQILADMGGINETVTLPDTVRSGSSLPQVPRSQSVGLEIASDHHPVPGGRGMDKSKCTNLEARGIHHELGMSPSVLEMSEPDVPEKEKQAGVSNEAVGSDPPHMANHLGEKVGTGREEDDRELDAQAIDGISTTVTGKKRKSRKRSNALQGDDLLGNQSKHTSTEKKKHKKRDGSFSFPVGDPITGNDFENCIPPKEALSLGKSQAETVGHDKHKEFPDSSEGLSSRPPNDDSLLQQTLTNDDKKLKKKKQTFKALSKIKSPIPSSACDMNSSHDMEVSFAQAGVHNDSLHKSSDAVSSQKETMERNPEEASEKNQIDLGKESDAAKLVEVAAQKVAQEVHAEDASGNNHEDLDSARTMLEDAVEYRGPAKGDSEDPSNTNTGSSHLRKRKKSRKTELFDLQPRVDETSRGLVNEENSKKILDHHHKAPGGECEETTVLGEASPLEHALAVEPEFPSKPNDRKPRRSRKRSAKMELLKHEFLTIGKEAAEDNPKEASEDNPKEASENGRVNVVKERELADPREAASLESLSKLDSIMPSDNSDRRLSHLAPDQGAGESSKEIFAGHSHHPGKESGGAIAIGEAAGLENHNDHFMDTGVPPKAIDKKTHRSRKKSAKTEVPSYEDAESEKIHSLGKEAAEENSQKSSNDFIDLHTESRKVTFHGKGSASDGLTEVGKVMPPNNDNTSSQVTEKGSKVNLVDYHNIANEKSKGPVVLEESPSMENPETVDSVAPSGLNDKKPRRSRKKSAKSELPNHGKVQSESVQFLDKEISERNSKKTVETSNVEPGKESKSATVGEEAATLEGPAKLDSVVLSNGVHADHQVTEEILKDALGEHQTSSVKKSKGSIVLGEASTPGNPSVADSGVPPEPAGKKPRRSGKKSAKNQLPGHDSVTSESIHSLGKEIAEENSELGKESKSAAVLREALAVESLAEGSLAMPSNISDRRSYHQNTNLAKMDLHSHSSGDLVHTSGNQCAQENLNQTLETKLNNPDNEPTMGILPVEAELNVEDRSKEAVPDISFKMPPKDIEEVNHMEHPKQDSDKVNFIDFFIPKMTQQDTALAEGLASVTDDRKLRNEKTKGKKKKSGIHVQDSPQHVVNTSSSIEQHLLKNIPHDANPVNHGLGDSLEQLTGKGKKTRKVHAQETVEGRRECSVHLGDPSSDLGSPGSTHDSNMTEKMIQDHYSTYHRVSKSIEKQNKHAQQPRKKASLVSESNLEILPNHERNGFMDSEHEVLESRNDAFSVKATSLGAPVTQNHSNVPSVVYPKGGIADRVTSDDSTEDTLHQRKRYRVAVRKVPSRRMAEVLKNSNPKKTMLGTSSTIFDGATSGSSDGEYDISNKKATKESTSDNSSTSADSDGEIEERHTTTQLSKKQAYVDSPGVESVANWKNNKGTFGGDNVLTQSSTVSWKSVPLSIILKSTSSYKKAKLTASQSLLEDSDSQPVDVVLETQPDSASL